jgi:ABC-2 type transport system permease protein
VNLQFVACAAAKDLRRIRRDPFGLLMWLGIPVALAALMGLFFGRAPVAPQGRLLVADLDQSLLSRVFGASFSQGPLAKMVVVENVSEAEGLARIGRGDASALLIVPKGLQDAFLENRPARLRLLTNPSQRILPRIVEETESIVVEAGFYVQKVAGAQLRGLRSGQAATAESVAAAAVAFHTVGKSLARYLDPPLIQVTTEVVEEKQQTSQSFAAIFLPSMVFMSLMFICNGLALDIWRERTAGALRRIAVSPAPLAAFLAGKLLTVAMVLGGVTALGLGSLAAFGAAPLVRLPAAALWLVLTGAAGFLLFLLVALSASTHRAASVWGNLIVLPLSMVGGCFFPFEMMPAWMAKVGRLTPNGWALLRFTALLDGRAGAAETALGFAVLIAVAALAFWLAARSLRRTLVA